METFHFFSFPEIKMTIMTSYFRIKDDVISIFQIAEDFYSSYIPAKFQHHLTWIRKKC